MPCYGHSHCALCNIPVCPDCIGNNKYNENIEDDESTSPDIDMNDNKYNWLDDGIAIYQNDKIFEVKKYKDGILGVLCDKYTENEFHSQYANIASALFLHKYCYDHILKNCDSLPTNKIWWFLAVYNVGIYAHKINDESNYYDCQDSLHQYYHKGNYDNNKYDDDSKINFMWLLKNPEIDKKNKQRIHNRFNKMLIEYDWSKPFNISGFRLK